MPPKDVKKVPDKLTDSEKKKIKQENKAKANPALAAGKKEKSDAKRERRKVRGMLHASPRTCYVPLRSRPPSLPAVPRPRPSSPTPPLPCIFSPRQESGSTKSFA
jgi:hypothetical protein